MLFNKYNSAIPQIKQKLEVVNNISQVINDEKEKRTKI